MFMLVSTCVICISLKKIFSSRGTYHQISFIITEKIPYIVITLYTPEKAKINEHIWVSLVARQPDSS